MEKETTYGHGEAWRNSGPSIGAQSKRIGGGSVLRQVESGWGIYKWVSMANARALRRGIKPGHEGALDGLLHLSIEGRSEGGVEEGRGMHLWLGEEER